MADDPTDLQAGPDPARPPPPSAREVNTVEPAPERARRARPDTPVEDRETPSGGGGPSRRLGDVPAALRRRYLYEPARGGTALAFYEGPGAKHPAFHDHGGRLSTVQSSPTVARDLALIAAHRGWGTVQVRGEDEFRRALWMEARALGLEVRGYKPRARDQQELDQRLAGREARGTRSGTRPNPAEAPERDAGRAGGASARDLDQGVSGTLLEIGRAPYQRRPDQAASPFIRLDRGDGAPLEIWGAALPEALQRSGAKVGDTVHVRRDGVDRVDATVEVRDPVTGAPALEIRKVTRNRWAIEAERFRQASPAQAARDPDFQGAQSHLAVIDAVIDRRVHDPERRARLHAEARETVAEELAEGRRFEPARVREIEPTLARDIGEASLRDRDGPERTLRR